MHDVMKQYTIVDYLWEILFDLDPVTFDLDPLIFDLDPEIFDHQVTCKTHYESLKISFLTL